MNRCFIDCYRGGSVLLTDTREEGSLSGQSASCTEAHMQMLPLGMGLSIDSLEACMCLSLQASNPGSPASYLLHYACLSPVLACAFF